MTDGDTGAGRDGTVAAVEEGATLLALDVREIRRYDRDPRQQPNPEYLRIKASIRAEGLDQPLVVTRRPGESDYMIHGGGNTRLRILLELYEETGEARFRDITCLYRPWTGETDVLLAHLRENDLRGPLNFLDKALAVDEAKRLIEGEAGTGVITQAELSAALKDRGYGLSQGLISQMQYAVERLLPLLPAALLSGLGRPQVERIRQLERAVRAIWLERAVDTEAVFDQTFGALCRRYDDPDWDIGHLRRALEAEIAEQAEVSIQAVSMMLETRLAGRHGEAGPAAQTETAAAPVAVVGRREPKPQPSVAVTAGSETEIAPLQLPLRRSQHDARSPIGHPAPDAGEEHDRDSRNHPR
ncbi:MAG: ParB family protein [Gammaproteobacteria bacterium]|nr:ParB family protein [Gammaproteobacteria bacterium]